MTHPGTAARVARCPVSGRAGHPVRARGNGHHQGQELAVSPVWSTTMPAITQPPQGALPGAAAFYRARPGRGRITALRHQAHQLISALTRRARRLHLRRRPGFPLEPMPRMRWYS